MSDAKKPVTVLDIKRATRSDIVALWKHCTRTGGKLDHVFRDQTKANEWLIGGDVPFPEAVSTYIGKLGASYDARNVKPATCLVIGASPEFFRPSFNREDPAGFGKYDPDRLEAWKQTTKKWLKDTFGSDCVAAHLHADERTIHAHALIVPTVEKAPTLPKNRRRAETEEAFERRVAKAQKRKPKEDEAAYQKRLKRIKPKREAETEEEFRARVAAARKKSGKRIVSHHKHHLFGDGRGSYEKVVDSYAAAVEHLGIARAERGSKASPTTKAQWARELLEDAKKADLKCRSIEAQAVKEQESFEYGTQAVLDETLVYQEADKAKERPDGLVFGPNAPHSEAKRTEIRTKVQPARDRIVAFARFVKHMAAKRIGAVEKAAIDAVKAASEALATASKLIKVNQERARQLDNLEAFQQAEIHEGELNDAARKLLAATTPVPRRPLLTATVEEVRVASRN
ncbi:MAG: hypothetical protein GJ677_19175 [Rhodobacteraceae bacterium]|nr:hypothetical protein [Paracoccaceae bacterium]